MSLNVKAAFIQLFTSPTEKLFPVFVTEIYIYMYVSVLCVFVCVCVYKTRVNGKKDDVLRVNAEDSNNK